MKPAIAKSYVAVDDLYAVHFTKPTIIEKASAGGVLVAEMSASHSYWQIMVLVLSQGFHWAFDGEGIVATKRNENQSIISIDVEFVIGRDGDVPRDKVIEDLRVKTYASTNFHEIIQSISRTVPRACPLGVQHRNESEKQG